MRKGFKRRYTKQENKKVKVIVTAIVLVCTMFLGVGYSVYKEEINRNISLSVNKPVFTITLNNNSATTAGTSTIYVKYGTGYYLNNLSNQMTTTANPITPPKKTGYVFQGYFTSDNVQIIDSNGKLVNNANTKKFKDNGTLTAKYIKLEASIIAYTNENVPEVENVQQMIDKLAEMLN